MLGVVIIPFRDELAVGDNAKPRWVRAVCEKLELPLLDLSGELQVSDYFETDVHFNSGGHIKVAKAVSEFANKMILAGEGVSTTVAANTSE